MKQIKLVPVFIGLTVGAALAVQDGIRVGPLRLSGWGEVSLSHDDNARLVVPDGEIQERSIFNDPNGDDSGDNQEDDYFYEVSLGLKLYRETESFLGSLSGFYSARRYDDLDDLDNESFGQEAELFFGNRELDKVTLDLRQSYRELFDNEYAGYPDELTNPDTRALSLAEDRRDRVSRELLDLGGIVTWQISDKLGSDYSIGYGSIDYDTDVLFDWIDIKGQAEFDYRVTDRSALLLTGQYGQQESDGLDNDPDYYVIRGGVLTRTTDKLTFKGGVGYGNYDRFRASEENVQAQNIQSGDGGAVDYFSFDIAGDWDLNPLTKVQIIGRNAVQPAAQYNDNVKLVSVASAGISRRFLEKFKISATGSYREDDYEDPVLVDRDEYIDQEDTIWAGLLRLDYEPPNKRLNVYAEGKYEDRNSNIPNEDYDQLILTLGVRVKI